MPYQDLSVGHKSNTNSYSPSKSSWTSTPRSASSYGGSSASTPSRNSIVSNLNSSFGRSYTPSRTTWTSTPRSSSSYGGGGGTWTGSLGRSTPSSYSPVRSTWTSGGGNPSSYGSSTTIQRSTPQSSVVAAMRRRRAAGVRYSGYVPSSFGQTVSKFGGHLGDAVADKLSFDDDDLEITPENVASTGAGTLASMALAGPLGILAGLAAGVGTKALMRTSKDEDIRKRSAQRLDQKMDWARIGMKPPPPPEPKTKSTWEPDGNSNIPLWKRKLLAQQAAAAAAGFPAMSRGVNPIPVAQQAAPESAPKEAESLEMYDLLPFIGTGAYGKQTFLNLRNQAKRWRRRQRPSTSAMLGGVNEQ